MTEAQATRDDSVELELLRNVLRTTVHDIGGLSGSLGLQARVMEQQVSERSIQVCSRIAAELRTLGNHLRQLTVRPQAAQLSPSRLASLAQWHAMLLHFGEPLLPRGMSLHGGVEDAELDPTTAFDLVHLWLALLRGLRELPVSSRSELHLSSDRMPHAMILRMRLVGVLIPPSLIDAPNAWWSWARRRADAAGIALRIERERFECVVSTPATQATPFERSSGR
jgi:hypothetical protein